MKKNDWILAAAIFFVAVLTFGLQLLKTTDEYSEVEIQVNGETVELTGKEDYIFVDVFDRITFDLNAGNGRAIATLVNGMEAEFSQPLNNGDRVEIYWKEK